MTVPRNPALTLPFRARQSAEARGRAAEDRAAEIYAARGCSVLARRARTEAGEIDLVAADATTLIFIEVKQRRRLDDAIEALQPRQQRRIVAAAAILLARNPDWERPDTRFDLVMVSASGIRHLPDAFRAE